MCGAFLSEKVDYGLIHSFLLKKTQVPEAFPTGQPFITAHLTIGRESEEQQI